MTMKLISSCADAGTGDVKAAADRQLAKARLRTLVLIIILSPLLHPDAHSALTIGVDEFGLKTNSSAQHRRIALPAQYQFQSSAHYF
jgi:sorbitol-specific phosphotransferase system component IIBC